MGWRSKNQPLWILSIYVNRRMKYRDFAYLFSLHKLFTYLGIFIRVVNDMRLAEEEAILAHLPKKGKEKRIKKSIWVTWVAKLMAGESLCSWSAWFKTHYSNYEKVPSKCEFIRYRLDHSRMINELRKERLARSEKVFVEEANRFSLEIKPNLTLDGKPDLIALAEDKATVYECKSAAEKDSYQIQLMIYLYSLPRCFDRYKSLKLGGCLLYCPGTRIEIPQSMADETFADHLNYWLEILGSDIPPAKAPSENECLFCNITKSDCPERVEKF